MRHGRGAEGGPASFRLTRAAIFFYKPLSLSARRFKAYVPLRVEGLLQVPQVVTWFDRIDLICAFVSRRVFEPELATRFDGASERSHKRVRELQSTPLTFNLTTLYLK
jgi:hypothetical protein